MARTYTIGFSQVSVSAAQDALALKCAATCTVRLLEVRLSQSASVTSTQLPVRLSKMTATVTLGSGGTTPAAGSLTSFLEKSETGDAAPASTFKCNDTTQATTSGAKTPFLVEGVNFLSGFGYLPIPEAWQYLAPGEGFVVELLTGVPAGTYSGALVFQEIG